MSNNLPFVSLNPLAGMGSGTINNIADVMNSMIKNFSFGFEKCILYESNSLPMCLDSDYRIDTSLTNLKYKLNQGTLNNLTNLFEI